MAKRNKETYRLIHPSHVVTIALDIGVEHTGMSIWSTEHPTIITQVDNNEPDVAKKATSMADLIWNEFTKHIKLYNPAKNRFLFVIEDYAYGRSYFNVLQPEIVGAFKYLLLSRNHSKIFNLAGVVFIPPSTAKKAVTGNGRATKAEVKRAVKEKGHIFTSGHEADSIAIYMAYRNLWDSAEEGMYRRSILINKGIGNGNAGNAGN